MTWELVAQLASIILPIVGARIWTQRREATKVEIERWASVAADAVVFAVEHGLVGEHADVVELWRTRVLELARAAGLNLNAAQLARAEAVASEKLGAIALQRAAKRLGVAAAALARSVP